jgi:primosomal protein N' (replication factor Y)
VETELERLFPAARVLRMDVDTTRQKNAHERILSAFKERKADILLGTQMIAKGLDFESVSLVGVISAEIGLTFPDFRASERVFQLLTQVAGRSGRTKGQGKVIIQTNLPDHYALKYAEHHDYAGFYAREIQRRHNISYPPLWRLVKLVVQTENLAHASRISTQIVTYLKRYRRNYFVVIGPAPAPISRIKNKYRWQIILKINPEHDPQGKNTRETILMVMENSRLTGLKQTDIYVDVDPVELL